MNYNKENIKIKPTLDNLSSATENKNNSSNLPPLKESSAIPPLPTYLSTGEKEEPISKLKSPTEKISEENTSIQNVKLKIRLPKSVSDSTDRKDILSQTQKSNEQDSTFKNIPSGTVEEHSSLNIVNTQKEKTQKIILKKEVAPKPAINLDEINIKPDTEEEENLKPEELSTSQEKDTNKIYTDNFEVVSSGNGKKHISDTVKLHVKPKTSSSSAFSTLTSEEKLKEDIQVKENSNIPDNSNSGYTNNSINKIVKKNARYLYLAVALIIMIVLLYFLISTIKILLVI